jgi:hypothetical protein
MQKNSKALKKKSCLLVKKYVAYPKEGFLLKLRMLRTSKGNPTEFADSTQNHHKIRGTSNQSITMKIFPKKSMFSILKVYRNQNTTKFVPEASKLTGPQLYSKNLNLKKKSV